MPAHQGLGPEPSRAREVSTSDAAADVDALCVDVDPHPRTIAAQPGSPNEDRHGGDPPTASRRARGLSFSTRGAAPAAQAHAKPLYMRLTAAGRRYVG